jgi:hypothetical protein
MARLAPRQKANLAQRVSASKQEARTDPPFNLPPSSFGGGASLSERRGRRAAPAESGRGPYGTSCGPRRRGGFIPASAG